MGKDLQMSSAAYRWLCQQPKPLQKYITAQIDKGYVLVKKVGQPGYKLVHRSRIKR